MRHKWSAHRTHSKPTVRTGLGSVPDAPSVPIVGMPVVNGRPVEPYELPDDPAGNERELARMAREEHERRLSLASQLGRGLNAVVEGVRSHRGPGFTRRLFHRWTVEWRQPPTDRGRRRRLEITRHDAKHLRGLRWNLMIDFWSER